MCFSICGGKQLEGRLRVSAAKNSILPIIAACILTKKTVVLKNCPPLLDVLAMLEIIKSMGGTAYFEGDNIVVNCRDITPAQIDSKLTRCIRSSIFILGPILSRFQRASVSYPGGCEIGERPIDLHLDGLRCLGVKTLGKQPQVGIFRAAFNKNSAETECECGAKTPKSECKCGAKSPESECECGANNAETECGAAKQEGKCKDGDDEIIVCDGSGMQGGEVNLRFPSVGATENIMMAAVLARGTTVINGAAREPEIEDLARFINCLGGRVFGAGTSSVVIHGVDSLDGGEFEPIPDRIVAGTYLAACAISGGKIVLDNVIEQHIFAVADRLSAAGCKLAFRNNSVEICAEGRRLAVAKTATMPHPGFPTDMQAQLVAVLCVAAGRSVIEENLFESRFRYAAQLSKLGADIKICGTRAVVDGVLNLHGGRIEAEDLRGGAALILAGLCAEGNTVVSGAHHIDRGYYKIEDDLSMLGANITRTGNNLLALS